MSLLIVKLCVCVHARTCVCMYSLRNTHQVANKEHHNGLSYGPISFNHNFCRDHFRAQIISSFLAGMISVHVLNQ